MGAELAKHLQAHKILLIARASKAGVLQGRQAMIDSIQFPATAPAHQGAIWMQHVVQRQGGSSNTHGAQM